jgi:hypothetical protein
MFEIRKGTRIVNGQEISTWARLANVGGLYDVIVECGSDESEIRDPKYATAFIRITSESEYDITFKATDRNGVEITATGGLERLALITCLEFAARVLRECGRDST